MPLSQPSPDHCLTAELRSPQSSQWRSTTSRDFPKWKTGWWYTYPFEKYDNSSVGMIVPNIWKNKIHVPNHQPEDSLNSFSFLGDQWFLGCPNFEKRPSKYCLHTFTRTMKAETDHRTFHWAALAYKAMTCWERCKSLSNWPYNQEDARVYGYCNLRTP